MINLEHLPVDITTHIRKFRDFLNACWPHLDDLMADHDWDDDGRFIDDWMQVNWELLVERELLGKQRFLTPLSTFYSRARITSPHQKANYIVYAKSDKQLFDMRQPGVLLPQDKTLRLYSFCKRLKNGFGLYPPFDLADVVVDSTKKSYIVPFDDVRFYLDTVSES